MLILAIDPGQYLGWSLQPTHKPIPDGHGHYSMTVTSADKIGVKLWRFYGWLNDKMNLHKIDVVAIEHAAMGAGMKVDKKTGRKFNFGANKELHGMYRGVAELVCHMRDVPLILVHPATNKLSATGSGRATKDQMRRSLATLYGIHVINTDEADAICIGMGAAHVINRGGVDPFEKKAPPKRKPSTEPKQQRLY